MGVRSVLLAGDRLGAPAPASCGPRRRRRSGGRCPDHPRGGGPTGPSGPWASVVSALMGNDYQIVHVAGHGRFEPRLWGPPSGRCGDRPRGLPDRGREDRRRRELSAAAGDYVEAWRLNGGEGHPRDAGPGGRRAPARCSRRRGCRRRSARSWNNCSVHGGVLSGTATFRPASGSPT